MKQALIGTALVICACTTPDDQRRAVENMGFSDVVILDGVPFFSCSDSDDVFFSANFSATNSAGKRVTGVVCCGSIGKACTVRF